ncbi:MAG: hypothetical protein ACREH8_22370 [Opitutaceae bacterium]
MALSMLFPPKTKDVDEEVNATAEVVTNLLKLQHYPPEKALLALAVAADKIETGRDNIKALRMRAALRGANAVRELADAEGGQLSAEQFGESIGVSRETVNQWRQSGRILGWKRGPRNYSYPAWQIRKGALLPGLESVLHALRAKTRDAFEIADYFLSESDELGGRPLDLLRNADVEPVVEHANRYGDIGA